jgi:hypothetical protein
MEQAAVTLEEVHAGDEGRLGRPAVDHPRFESRFQDQELQGPQALLFGLEDGHLDLLGGHGRHVTRLLAEEQLGRLLPLAKREGAEHREHRGRERHRHDRESLESLPHHRAPSNSLITRSVRA